MSLKKFIVNGLAVVGAVVVADKIVNAVCNKSTKAISEELLKKFTHDGESSENTECDEDTECKDNLCEDDETEKEEDSSENNDSEEKTYEFTVKAENITSDPKEV